MVQAENPGGAAPKTGPGLSLRRRVQSGGAVIMSGFGVGQVLRLLSNLILTRLLMPEAFGLMAVAVSINIWSVMLTDIGINTSVIRSKNSDNPKFLHTAWTIQIVRNLIVWAIICLAALTVYLLASQRAIPPDSIFAHPLLPWVMAGIGLQLPISGLTSINWAMAERRLSMKRVVTIEVTAQLFTMMLTIAFALAGYGVWALVIGTIGSAIFKVIASHTLMPGPRMALAFVREHFDEIFGFGKWLIIASFFGFILNRGDQILFGWMMDADNFSQYAIATIWVVAATAVVQTVFARVFLPAFSEIYRERPGELANAYQKVRLLADAAVVMIAFGAFFLAEPLFQFIYPEQYEGVGRYIRLLSPVFLFLPYRLISIAALAAGDSKRFAAITFVGGTLMVIFVPLVYTLFDEKLAIIFFACIAVWSLPLVWRLGQRLMKLNVVVESRMIAAAAALVALLLIVK